MSAAKFNAADEERLRTWIFEIIEILGENITWRLEGDERRASGLGGLTINTRSGCWYCHSLNRGHWSTIPLIEHLRQCDRAAAAAVAWAAAWLKEHPGTGSLADASPDEGDTASPSASIAQELLDRATDPIGTAAAAYMKSRGISGALPPCIKFLSDARTGEGALVGILTSHGRITGIQLTYLDPAGRKSTVPPARRRFNLEKAADAVFEIQVASANVADLRADTLITEGLEDGLSLAELGRSLRIIALPGIGALAHLPVKKGERIVVVRDGDPEGSAADTALHKGVDHLLLEGAVVTVTETPPGEDANSTLQHGGTVALAKLVSDAAAAELSLDGEFIQLARLNKLEFEFVRRAEAKRLGIRVTVLQEEVERRRRRASGTGGGEEEEAPSSGPGKPIELTPTELWEDLVDGAVLLTDISTTIRKYVVLEPTQADAVALFSVFTHAFDQFETAPKLAPASAQKRSGKTRLLEVLGRLVTKPLQASGISAAALLRVIEKHTPTLLLDELDTLMRGDAELAEALRGVLNSGFDRATARIIKNVPVPDGGWEPREFSTWCPQALAGIGSLPDTVADRSIRIEMKRKRRSEKVARLRSRDGGDLRLLARMAARWAKDNRFELSEADPATPVELNDRAADAWAPLLAIADVAGGEWPQRTRSAAIALSGKEEETSSLDTELLSDIRDAFDGPPPPRDRLSSATIVEYLLTLEHRPWAELGRSQRPMTQHGLAARLKKFRISPRSIKLAGKGDKTQKGYYRAAFEDAFERYLSPAPPFNSSDEPAPRHNPQESSGNGGFQSGTEDAACRFENDENPSVSVGCAGVPDRDDENEVGAREEAPEPGPNGAARDQNGAEPTGTHPADDYAAASRPNRRRLNPLEATIIECARTNPTHSLNQIAKKYGQPRSDVTELLKRELPDAPQLHKKANSKKGADAAAGGVP